MTTRLEEIKARVAAANQGPWTAQNLEADHGHRGIYWVSDLTEGSKTIAEVDASDGGVEAIWRYADAEFIAHAREDVPKLLAALEAVLSLADDDAQAGRHYIDAINHALEGEPDARAS